MGVYASLSAMPDPLLAAFCAPTLSRLPTGLDRASQAALQHARFMTGKYADGLPEARIPAGCARAGIDLGGGATSTGDRFS